MDLVGSSTTHPIFHNRVPLLSTYHQQARPFLFSIPFSLPAPIYLLLANRCTASIYMPLPASHVPLTFLLLQQTHPELFRNHSIQKPRIYRRWIGTKNYNALVQDSFILNPLSRHGRLLIQPRQTPLEVKVKSVYHPLSCAKGGIKANTLTFTPFPS